MFRVHIDLVQDCSISLANALEILQSCIKSLILSNLFIKRSLFSKIFIKYCLSSYVYEFTTDRYPAIFMVTFMWHRVNTLMPSDAYMSVNMPSSEPMMVIIVVYILRDELRWNSNQNITILNQENKFEKSSAQYGPYCFGLGLFQ